MQQFLGTLQSATLGMILYGAYSFCFGLAIIYAESPGSQQQGGSSLDFCLFGSFLGGLGAACIWTAQGVFFIASAAAVGASGGEPTSTSSTTDATARLASEFGVIYLILEVIFKVSSTLLMSIPWLADPEHKDRKGVVFLLYALLGICCGVLNLILIKEPPQPVTVPPVEEGAAAASHSSSSTTSPPAPRPNNPLKKVTTALKLWSDSRIWLLSPLNISFGVAVTFLNGFVNKTITEPGLGANSPGALSSLTALFSAGAAALCALKKSPELPITAGAFALGLIPLIVLCPGVNWWITGSREYFIPIIYMIQGLGRGAYESANKAAWGEAFSTDEPLQKAGAFANLMIQNSATTSLFFFIGAKTIDPWILGFSQIFFALLVWPGYKLCKKKLKSMEEIRRTEEGNKQGEEELVVEHREQ